jgi:hypothetical protein
VPEPNCKETVERNDFPLLKFCDFFLLGDHVGHQGLFALGNCIDLQPLNMLFFLSITFSTRLGNTFMVMAYSWNPIPVGAAMIPGNVL